MKLNSIAMTIEAALARAGLNSRLGALGTATTSIRKALAAAGLLQRDCDAPSRSAPPWRAPGRSARAYPDDVADARPAQAPRAGQGGQFLSRTISLGADSLDYKLFIPSGGMSEPAPLIVMLHGCKQTPDDFATGTGMNELAQAQGFLVAYPAQTARANGSRCWNWFEVQQQSRGGVEASLIAAVARDVSQAWRVDGRRVFVAGLSAGGAMALILGNAYPEVFTAVGVHSGVALGAAHDVGSAFAAMRGVSARSPSAAPSDANAVPTIVFHGDADHTVSDSNAREITAHARRAFEAAAHQPLREILHPRNAVRGREVSTTQYLDADGKPRVEHWVLHGADHAWAGGDKAGSYTDAKGPSASQAMVDFFLRQ